MDLASLEPILVRNCAGGYDPYVQQHPREADLDSQPLMLRRKIVLD